MKWRKWNNIIHRDLGYLCFGMTIIFAVSGFAVNHINDWNPSYSIENIKSNIGDLSEFADDRDALVKEILNRVGETGLVKSAFRQDPETIEIFVEGNNILVKTSTGDAVQEKIQERSILKEMNFLHLNHARKMWTYFSDAYAVSLFLLAVTGLFVLKGRNGLKGRGKWFAGAGVLAPILFLIAYL